MKHIRRIFLISLFCLSFILFPLISYAVAVDDASYISEKNRLLLWGIGLLTGVASVMSYRYLNSRMNSPIYLEAGARSRLEATEKYEFTKKTITPTRLFLFFATFSVHLFLFSLTTALFLLVPLELWSAFLATLKMKFNESLKETTRSKLPSISFFYILGLYFITPYTIFRIEIVDSGLEGFVTAILDSLVLAITAGLLIPYLFVPKLYKKPSFHEKQNKQPMQKVDLEVLLSALTKVERVAHELGSVRFEGWRVTPNSKIHIRAHVVDNRNFSHCLHCKELTVTRKQEVLESPSYSSKGKRLVIHQCHCCDYRKEKQENIPRLRRSSSSVSTNYGGGYSSGSSGGSSGGDGGGGSFGGGSSGGGGADGGF